MRPKRFTDSTTNTKSEQPVKKSRFKFKTFLFLTLILIIGALFFTALFYINNFFEYNKFVFKAPIVIQFNKPIDIKARELPSPIPQSTDSARINIIPEAEAENTTNDYDLQVIAEFVRWRESNNGKAPSGHHVTCREQGLTNEYGYAPHLDYCFNSESEALNAIKDWFTRSLEVRTLSESLCRYNMGTPVSDCKYYQDYLSYTLK